MQLVKDNDKGRTYQADKLKILYRREGSISGDNSENVEEHLYFIEGSAKITLVEDEWTIRAPVKVHFPANTYHKIEALTDISFVLLENN